MSTLSITKQKKNLPQLRSDVWTIKSNHVILLDNHGTPLKTPPNLRSIIYSHMQLYEWNMLSKYVHIKKTIWEFRIVKIIYKIDHNLTYPHIGDTQRKKSLIKFLYTPPYSGAARYETAFKKTINFFSKLFFYCIYTFIESV